MAKQEMEIKVSIEKAVHDGIATVLQKIWDEHGICITSIDTAWLDISTVAQPGFLIKELELTTKTIKEN